MHFLTCTRGIDKGVTERFTKGLLLRVARVYGDSVSGASRDTGSRPTRTLLARPRNQKPQHRQNHYGVQNMLLKLPKSEPPLLLSHMRP